MPTETREATNLFHILSITSQLPSQLSSAVDCVWNVMAHAQKPDFVFRQNGRVLLIVRGRQFSRLLAAEVCAWEVVMFDPPCSEEVWRVLATHSIRQLPLHFPSRAWPCAITFHLDCTPQSQTLNSWFGTSIVQNVSRKKHHLNRKRYNYDIDIIMWNIRQRLWSMS